MTNKDKMELRKAITFAILAGADLAKLTTKHPEYILEKWYRTAHGVYYPEVGPEVLLDCHNKTMFKQYLQAWDVHIDDEEVKEVIDEQE